MSQTDRHKTASGKKTQKAQGGKTPSPVASIVPMQARDDADKKAMEAHDGLQDLNRRNGELEAQVGELDAELKKAREAAQRSEGRATEAVAKAARVGDLEQEIGALRKQLEQVQTWAAEMSAQAATVPDLKAQVEKAVAAEKAAREELNLEQERHVTVVRAKDEKVAEAEKRALAGMKRLKDAHDSVLRDEAHRATASEKQAREELKKLQDLHEAVMREAGPMRSQVAELRAQVEKSGELHKDIDALSQQIGQAVGARDKMRRELDEARSLLNHTREELKKAQDLRDESERGGAALRSQIVDLERKLKDDPRVPALEKDLAALREELTKAQELKVQVADLERQLREIPKEDPRLAPLREELAKAQTAAQEAAAFKARAEKAEAASAESERYFVSIEKELVEALEQADKAETLRAELDKMKEECRDHEEGLDQLAETVMELDHLLELATKDKPGTAPPTAPVVQVPPPPPPAPKPVVVAAPPVVKVEPVPPPAPKPVVVAPPPVKIELDFFDAPPPAPAPVVVPPAVLVPSPAAASNETTLRTNNTFGPNGEDGQPLYLLHEMLPKDAMGVVYRATERSSGRAFAVRFMAGQAGEDQTRAFEKEVEKLISLPHPNILHVQGTGRRKNRLYVMMDLVEGPTLGALKIPEIPRICAILRDAASALNYAHEEGIFHGDVNPESIVVSKEDGKDLALVKDFGLACLLETQTAGLRNPAFLPPEQVRVLKSPLSAAGDVYGLGATLFAALTGRAPFEGKDAVQISKRVMIEEPPPVEKFRPDVPKAVSAVVRRAMAKERGVRFASAQEMADALSKFLGPS